MSERTLFSAINLFDNASEESNVGGLLRRHLEGCTELDVATGFLEIGGLLELADGWQKLKRIRILMGDHVGQRTRQLLIKALRPRLEKRLEQSLGQERRGNPLLEGVVEIAKALNDGRIECRMHTKAGGKFHAKAYVLGTGEGTTPKAALVGSSNFTRPGLTQNIELNVEYRDEASTQELASWFEEHWKDGEEVQDQFLEIIERTIREYTPYEVYLKAVTSLIEGQTIGEKEWETTHSEIYPLLDEFQKRGYREVLRTAESHGGAFLCDGVGMGKTFIGLMLIERMCRFERKRVALFAPKSARESVWDIEVENRLKNLDGAFGKPLRIFNHTDFQRRAGGFPGELEKIRNEADVVIIDEAHYFRNRGSRGMGKAERSWYWKLYDLIGNHDGTTKTVFLLTATPINNGLRDFRNELELFTREDNPNSLAQWGIPSIPAHIKELEKDIEAVGKDPSHTPDMLKENRLFKEVVTQRSRTYAKELQKLDPEARELSFPERDKPRVADYSIRQTCGPLLDHLQIAFDRDEPALVLSLYYPLKYELEDNADEFEKNRQAQLVGLIRTLFLKRLESSIRSFESSCDRLLRKMIAWCEKHCEGDEETARLKTWKGNHGKLLGYVTGRQHELWGEDGDPTEPNEEDVVPIELLEAIEVQRRDKVDVAAILEDTFNDMDQLIGFLELAHGVDDAQDDKVRVLIEMLESQEDLVDRKVLVFTEFADTARYLEKRLVEAGVKGVESVTSRSKKDRRDVVKRFSPFYNDTTSVDLQSEGRKEIEILISTDMLADGLNLQDATRLINYDIHWNPVQIIQRIGRIDRRLTKETEDAIQTERAATGKNGERGRVVYWNFLPPKDLEMILRLHRRVSGKTLVISKTMGVQTGHLLSPDEELDDIQQYTRFEEFLDGKPSVEEEMSLELAQALDADPELAERVGRIPDGVLSGRVTGSSGCVGVFFCYRLPGPDHEASTTDELRWTAEAGRTAWYFAPLGDGEIATDLAVIRGLIRCERDEPRRMRLGRDALLDAKERVDSFIKDSWTKKVQAPMGVEPELVTWMELNEG